MHSPEYRESWKLRSAGKRAMGAAPGSPGARPGGPLALPDAAHPETTGAADAPRQQQQPRGPGGRAAPKALRSFLRNFLSDDLGSFRSEINLKDHGEQSGTTIRDVTIQEVADMHPDLRSLTLSGCTEVTDVGLWALARSCTALRELRMARCTQISHIGLRSLSLRCRGLEVIDLSDCPTIDDNGLRVLAAGCWGLHTLSFRNCKRITDTGLTEIARMCKHLRDVDVSGCEKVCEYGDKALVELAGNCHNLTSLNLTGCSHVGNSGVRAVARGCPRLSKLTLSGCERLDSPSVRALARGCTALRTLSLSGCRQIMNGDLWFLLQSCRQIRALDLQGCENLHSNGMHALAEWGQRVSSLSLRGCQRVDDAALAALSTGATALLTLDLSACPRVGQDGIRALTSTCTRLVNLNVTQCPKVGETFLRHLINSLPFVGRSPTYRGFRALPDAMERIKRAEVFRLETAAALRVQAAWRACMARGGVSELRRLAKITWVVPKFQALVRGHCCRCELERKRRLEELDLATRFVQRVWRGRCARVLFDDLKVQRRLHRYRDRTSIKIERVYRGHVARMRAEELRQARIAREIEAVRKARVRLVAAGHLQSWWRGYIGRRLFMEQLRAARLRRLRELRRVEASIQIQTIWRGFVAKIEAETRRERLRQAAREEAASRQIQRVYRGYVGREEAKQVRRALEYEEMVRAAKLIQRAWRGERGRHLYAVLRAVARLRHHEEIYALRIQGWWRGVVGRRLFHEYRDFMRTKEKRLHAIAEFQRVFRGHKGREQAEVQRALKAIEGQTGPLKEKIERLSRDRELVEKDQVRMQSFLEKSKELKAEVEGELREVSIVKSPFYDTNKITGVLQRFKTAYLKTALEATIDGLKARSEVESRAVVQVMRSMNEIDKAIRILQRKLKPLLQSCESDVRERRGERLRALVRQRERSATMFQALVRAHRVRQALRRCGGVNYWVEAVDEDGMTYYFNTWTQERLEADAPPFEMRLFGGRGGRGGTGRGVGTSERAVGGDVQHPGDSAWTECFDEESGFPYYFNSETGEYTWEAPETTDIGGSQRWLEQEHMQQLSERQGGGGGAAFADLGAYQEEQVKPRKPVGEPRKVGEWEELWDEESQSCYYYHSETGEYHWEKPEGFDQQWLGTQDTMAMTARSARKREAGPWQELFDPETATTYYYNERSGESRWDPPSGFDQRWLDQQDVAALTARSTQRRLAGDWTEMQDEDTGTVYYVNKHTGESQWGKPDGFDGQWLFEADTAAMVARSRLRKNAGLWQEYFDEEAQCAYYYNTDTAESQFRAPRDFLLDWIETKERDGSLDAESVPGRTGGPWEEFALVRPRNAFTDAVRQQKQDAVDAAAAEEAADGGGGEQQEDEEEEEEPLNYYKHFSTGELRVQPPADFAEQHRMGSLRASGRVLPRRQVNGRIELMDSRTGNIFYFDRSDRVYSWDKPVGFDDVWLQAAIEQDGGRALLSRSKKKKRISAPAETDEQDEGGDPDEDAWCMYVDPDTETTFYWHGRMKAMQASLPPADAHGMNAPPSAVGGVGAAVEQGLVQGHKVSTAPPPEVAEVLKAVQVPRPLLTKLGRVQRERVPYEERRTHLRWIEEFIEAQEFVTADSVADQ